MLAIIGQRWPAKPPRGSLPNPAHPLARGLVSAWVLNEGAGQQVYDEVSRKAGTLSSSGATWTPGPHGSVLKFNGAAGTQVLSPFQAITSAFSVAMRFNASSYGSSSMLVEHAGNWRIGFNATGGNALLFDISFVSDVQTISTPSLNAWHTVVARCDPIGGTSSISLDAGAFASTASGAARTNTANLSFGNAVAGNLPFFGMIDYLYIYKRALSTPEAKALVQDPYVMWQASAMRRFYAPPKTGQIFGCRFIRSPRRVV